MGKKHKNTSYQGTQQDDEINVTTGTYPRVGAMVNTFDSDKIGFCHQTGLSLEQLESWFGARQVAFFMCFPTSFSVPACQKQAIFACFPLQRP